MDRRNFINKTGLGAAALSMMPWIADAETIKPRMKVGAYYFAGWAGRNASDDGKPGHEWAKGMPFGFTKRLATEFSGREPLWGWRDDTGEIMQKQINLGADNGIAFFSFCWYYAKNKGPIDLAAIERDPKHLAMKMFMEAKNNDRMEFSLLVANHEGFEIVGEEAWKQAADYWIKLFKHPRYLKVDGMPFLAIFSPRGGNTEGFKYLQGAAREAGFKGFAIACCGKDNYMDGYNYRTHYNVITGYGQPSAPHDYKELVDGQIKEWGGSSEMPYIPVALVGWDRRPWETADGLNGGVPTSWYFTDNTPQAFGDHMEKMARWIEEHPDQATEEKLAIIYAWNETGEGGWLIPCRDDPDGKFLKVVRKVVYRK